MSSAPPVAKTADAAGESNSYERINDFGAVRISLASPQDIRSWSHGEVKKPETINYRTYRPEKDGLFCERIFGPEKDWECTCGKYRGMKYKGMVCDRCGVKVTHSRVRRKRMGHIELAAPVVHIWFFKAMPSRLGTLLDMKTTNLEKIIYFQDYVVIDPGPEGATGLKERQILTEDQYKEARQQFGDVFEVDMGAEAIKKLLEKLNLTELATELRTRLEKELARGDKASKQRLKELVKRLKTVESLRDSSNKCEYMVLECIPVIPPDLRPLVLLDSGNFATSDLNDLYRRIINRNNRLKKLVDLNAPEVIIRNEKRMLQQSVDALFDNNRCKRPVLGSSNRPLKSLTDMIKGKQGRFRENLLGKRVDYSARSVIVVGPELKLHQCGLPKKIALELFQPFIIRRLKELQHADTIKSAKKMLERKDDVVWDILEEVTKSHPVMLNRAPTLHRMGIQAFEPVLIEGNAIRIHPLVCKGFNADFDGDQMAVHLPLSIEAQVEATVLMMSTNNIFSPANGNPIITPSQDIVMGCYYLTAARGTEDEAVEAGDGMKFHSAQELFRAFAEHKLGLHAKVWVRLPQGYVEVTDAGDTKLAVGALITQEAFFAEEAKVREHNAKRGATKLRLPLGNKFPKKVVSEVKDEKGTARAEELPRKPNGLVRTTVGRAIFNDILHPKMAFYDLALSSKYLSRIIADCYQLLGRRETIALLDRMKETGFRQATRSGLSFASSDLRTPENKEGVLKDKDKEVEKVRKQFERGIITEVERYNKVIDTWMEARDMITKKMMTDLANDRREDQVTKKVVPYLNPIYLMAHSGARGGIEQIRQLAGMRGLMAKPSGAIIETPIKSNFREGLTVLEYFSSTHGARKGLADTALKTADSGYLTRKLADVAQNVVITMHDCGTTRGMSKGVMYKGEEIDRSLADSIRGRVSRETIKNPTTREVIVEENQMIDPFRAKELEKAGFDKIMVRSPMTCDASLGVCRLCYGMDLATGALVEDGMAVGIIAAQSIGEPGTQLTMRTFHIGGVASKGAAADSEHKTKKGGLVQFERIRVVTNDEGRSVALAPRTGELLIVRGKDGPVLERFGVPNGAEVLVAEGQEVAAGTSLVKWDPHSMPIVTEEGGTIKYQDIKEGVTLRKDKDSATGIERRTIMEHKGDLHPVIQVLGDKGVVLKWYPIPERANIQVTEGQKVGPGTLLAKTPREVSQQQDITGGLPRVTELFEARRPRNPAVMAEIDGKVRMGDKKRGKKLVYVVPETDDGKPTGDPDREHQVPGAAHMRVHPGEYVKAGDALVHGPLVPHDILKIKGADAVQEYMCREVQAVYRSQRVDIDDKHIEIIVSQMLRKVKVTDTGDTGLLPGAVMDTFAFNEVNRRTTEECVKIVDPGDAPFEAGKVVSKEAFEEVRAGLEKASGKKRLPTCVPPEPASNEIQLLGITKAAVQSDSFISAASFQETTKVLTEAALASKVDYLVGLKENVILGHLIPAGTGFKTHQEAEVKINMPGDYRYGGAPEPEAAADATAAE
jgi:DNA-directed RNA polymerase subunit beta'